MEAPASKLGWVVVACLCVVTAAAGFAQNSFDSSEIPPKFNLDMKTRNACVLS